MNCKYDSCRAGVFSVLFTSLCVLAFHALDGVKTFGQTQQAKRCPEYEKALKAVEDARKKSRQAQKEYQRVTEELDKLNEEADRIIIETPGVLDTLIDLERRLARNQATATQRKAALDAAKAAANRRPTLQNIQRVIDAQTRLDNALKDIESTQSAIDLERERLREVRDNLPTAEKIKEKELERSVKLAEMELAQDELGKALDELEKTECPGAGAGLTDVGSPRSAALRTEIKTAGGLTTITFKTPGGSKLLVNLTDDLAAGDTISGTISLEPAGKTETERQEARAELNGFVVELEEQRTPASERILKRTLPPILTRTSDDLILRDREGKEIARTELSISSRAEPTREKFDLPTSGQVGKPIEVKGPSDGDFATTEIRIGQKVLPLLAESPRKIVALNVNETEGPTEIVCKEQGKATEGKFRSVAVKLSAPKLNLLKGEQTTVSVVVSGLADMEQNETVPLELVNESPGVVNMGGGDQQNLTIRRGDVQPGGLYSFGRNLTGIRPGAFTIFGTVIRESENRDTRRNVVAEDKTLASRWRFVESGGNLKPGVISDLGQCPCGQDYTVNSKSVYSNPDAKPNAAQFQACLANPPPHRAPTDKCKGDCVLVKTHQWHGYRLLRDSVTDQWALDCYTFAQFHCKKPDDPDARKPAKDIDPASEKAGREKRPKTSDVEP